MLALAGLLEDIRTIPAPKSRPQLPREGSSVLTLLPLRSSRAQESLLAGSLLNSFGQSRRALPPNPPHWGADLFLQGGLHWCCLCLSRPHFLLRRVWPDSAEQSEGGACPLARGFRGCQLESRWPFPKPRGARGPVPVPSEDPSASVKLLRNHFRSFLAGRDGGNLGDVCPNSGCSAEVPAGEGSNSAGSIFVLPALREASFLIKEDK